MLCLLRAHNSAAAAAAPLNMTATTMNTATTAASHRLPDEQLASWTRNDSTDRTIYAPSTSDAASIYTTKTAVSTRSFKDRFRFFRRKQKQSKEKDGSENTPRPNLKERTSSDRLKKKPSAETIHHAKMHSPKAVQGDHSKRFSVDKDTGEHKDHTEMLHALVHHESFDSTPEKIEMLKENRDPGEPMIASLPPQIWQYIATLVTPCDAASLAFASKTLFSKIGRGPWDALRLPENRQLRTRFLLLMDAVLPNHLYCPLCDKYHVRTQKGKESLKPTLTLNPLFKCPNVETIPPRVRITSGRTLPFTFVQLALRAHKYGPDYGLTLQQLARRWKEPETGWSHSTVYRVHNNHLIMRVISQRFAEGGMMPAAKRKLFYNMLEDFTPYFSVCAHWRDGELMDVCKCAVDHIPKPRYSITERHKMQMKALPEQPRIVTLCGVCQPVRRCPQCPTEYLTEIKLVEDKADPVYTFKQSIVITRWTDLGDGSTPSNTEWAAVNGLAEYDSIIEIGRRALSGIFEAKTSNDNMNIPGQRVVSLNPKMEHEGEAGDKWY